MPFNTRYMHRREHDIVSLFTQWIKKNFRFCFVLFMENVFDMFLTSYYYMKKFTYILQIFLSFFFNSFINISLHIVFYLILSRVLLILIIFELNNSLQLEHYLVHHRYFVVKMIFDILVRFLYSVFDLDNLVNLQCHHKMNMCH